MRKFQIIYHINPWEITNYYRAIKENVIIRNPTIKNEKL